MESFFYLVVQDDQSGLISEFICRRYSNPEYILSMDLLEFEEFYKAARKKEAEEKLWERWLTVHPYMSLGYLKPMSFKDYMDKMTGRNIDRRSDDEIIKELETLHGKKLI